jgi:hypothetical protein
MNPTMNDTNAIITAAKHGRKYGWSVRNASHPKVSGQWAAGRNNNPPMMELCRASAHIASFGMNISMTHASVTPEHHIRGIRAKASAMLVESVI